jgi:hypothetical protein
MIINFTILGIHIAALLILWHYYCHSFFLSGSMRPEKKKTAPLYLKYVSYKLNQGV